MASHGLSNPAEAASGFAVFIFSSSIQLVGKVKSVCCMVSRGRELGAVLPVLFPLVVTNGNKAALLLDFVPPPHQKKKSKKNLKKP